MNGFASALSLLVSGFQAVTTSPGYGVAIWFLAVVFFWSGIVKLRQPTLAAMAMVDFRVARKVRTTWGFAQGLAETALALALAFGIMLRLSVVIAAILLWFFALLIGRSLRTGDRFACFCFGDAESQLSRVTLLRTAALALLASILALAPIPRDISPGLSVVSLLDAIASGALLATIVLISYMPRLIRWNRDPVPASTSSSIGGD